MTELIVVEKIAEWQRLNGKEIRQIPAEELLQLAVSLDASAGE